MEKRKRSCKRLYAMILALALAVTSVSLPTVTVKAAKTVKVQKVQITKPKKKSVTLKKGKTLQLKVKVTPKNAKNKKVTYKTSNKKVATVSKKGKIKGKKNGTAKITVTAKDGSRKKATLKVKVVTLVSSVKLNESASAVEVGKTAALKASVAPKTASNKKIKWTTSNKNIATVTSQGIVQGISVGTVKITAAAADGSKKKAVCQITVRAAAVPKPQPQPQPPVPAAAALEQIEITKAPDKTTYRVGEKFDPSGMEVTASYSDRSKKTLERSAYTISPDEHTALKAGDTKVTVTYQEGERTAAAETPITVTARTPGSTLQSIAVTKGPDKTQYWIGDVFDPSGMEVEATYSDGVTELLNPDQYTFSPNGALSAEDTEVTISCEIGAVTKTAAVEIFVTERPAVYLTEIEISGQPAKTEYSAGENFDPAGMEVTAHYSDGESKVLASDAYTLSPDTTKALTAEDTEITVTYQEGAAKVSAKIQITVKGPVTLRRIEVVKEPKTDYHEGDRFDPSGMEVEATYSDGSKKKVTDYTYEERPLTPLDQSVEIIYTENGITRKTEVTIAVEANNKLVSLQCSLNKNKLEREGLCFLDEDITITAVFANGQKQNLKVSDCQISPAVFTKDTTSASITYYYGTGRKTIEVNGFTVVPYRKVFTFQDQDTMGTIVKNPSATDAAEPIEENTPEVEPEFAQGLQGNALHLDGTYGVRLDGIENTESNSYSVSMWVKPDSLAENKALVISSANHFGMQQGLAQTWCSVVGSDDRGGIKLWSHDTVQFNWTNVAQTQIPVGTDADWSHIVLTVDGSTTAEGAAPGNSRKALGTLYVNGRKVGSGNVRNEKGPDMKTYLGITAWPWDGCYSGLIDEVTFASDVLTQDEVEEYYLQYFADQASKITEVSADGAQAEVDYGSSLEEVTRLLEEKISFKGTADETQVPLTDVTWTLNEYSDTTEGQVTATAKIAAPKGYVFAEDGQTPSLWKTAPVEVKIKTPVIINEVTPSAEKIEAEYGTPEAEIIESLAALTFTAAASDGSAYLIANEASLWKLTQNDTGYLAVAALPKAKPGYKYAEGKATVTVNVKINQPVMITSLGVSEQEASMEVAYNTPLSEVKQALSELTLLTEVNEGQKPSFENTQEIWSVEGYEPKKAGEYTAKAEFTAPVGYKFSESVGVVNVKVTVQERGAITKIQIVDSPKRTKYLAGHTFEKAGMTVTAVYANGGQEDVTDRITVDETAPLQIGQESVEVSYTDGEGQEAKTVKVSCPITVASLAEGAIAYYAFDENLNNGQIPGNAAKMVKNRDLTDSAAAASYEKGVDGKGIVLNDGGEELAVQLDTTVSHEDPFTISLWVKPKSLDRNWAMILTGTNYERNNKQLVLYACPGGNTNALNVQNGIDADKTFENHLFAGEWTMLTWVNHGASMELYVNGKKAGDGPGAKTGLTRILLGGGWWDPFHAVIDETRIYDCALSPNDVEEMYGWISQTVSGVSVSEEAMTILKEDSSPEEIQARLKSLKLTAVLKNAKTLELANEEDWALPQVIPENGTFSAEKKITLPEGYVPAEGVPDTVSVQITVKNTSLASLTVTKGPKTTSYFEGEAFDAAGMEVTAAYANGDTKPLTLDEIVIETASKDSLLATDTVITISYTEGGKKQEASIPIEVVTVEGVMESITPKRTAYYTFDEKLTDEISNAGAEIVKNRPEDPNSTSVPDAEASYVDGMAGKAIRFAGNGKHSGLRLEAKINSQNYTVSMWLRPETQAANYAGAFYAWKNDNHYLSWYSTLDQGGFIGMSVNGRKDSGAISNMFKNNEWTMVTWTMEGGVSKVYLNGVLAETADQHAGFFAGAEDIALYLGSGCIWDESFNGAWDEVSLFNDALTEQQIKGLYKSVADGANQ